MLLWEDEWTNTQGNKLLIVKPSMQTWHSCFSAVRKEEVVCLWIGHTRLTHGNLLCDKPAPYCFNCDVPLTVSDILVDCRCCSEDHRENHLHSTLTDMLGDVDSSISKVLAF
jgi:hypothetical protein